MLAALTVAYSGVAESAPPARKSTEVATTPSTLGWVRGRLLVAPRAGLSAAEFEKALRGHQGRARVLIKGLNVHVVELPAGANEIAVKQVLSKSRKFKYVELDMAVAQALTVSDPSASSSWAFPRIGTPAAWDSANGSGVTIAILDTGVDSAHPDLQANLVPGWNFYDNNSDTADVHGHGTMVAGAAAAVANNAKGSAGVAWGAKIMPIRISAPDGYAYYSTIAQGINWAADRGARVVNVSFAGVSGSSSIQSAADYMRSKGGVVVVAAGNSGGLEEIQASDSLLTAAATDSADVRASFSSYGNYVDIAAPGVSIYTTTRGGGFSNGSGTSFASPVLAATAALVMSANTKLGPSSIDAILKSTALDLGSAGYDAYYGAGRVDAAKAVAAAKSAVATDTQAPSISIAAPTGGNVAGVVPVDVNYSDNAGVTRVELYLNGTKLLTDSAGPFAFTWDTTTLLDGGYTLVAKAFDAAGNVGTSSSVAVTVGNDTTAPVISSFNLTEGMTIGAKQSISASATDNQAVAKISLTVDGKEVAITYGGSVSYNWNTRRLAKGAHSVQVRAWDKANNTVSRSVTVYKK
jgi:subtilisin family serine protease